VLNLLDNAGSIKDVIRCSIGYYESSKPLFLTLIIWVPFEKGKLDVLGK